jgi:hypothetical protein
MIAPGRLGERVPRAVPQVGQNSRVTACSMSLRVKRLGSPFVKRKPASGMTMITFGLPPVMYWHSRQ